MTVDFATLFQDVLTQFDTQPDDFSPQRVQDELVGQMAELLEADYDTLALEINDSESRQRALTSEPAVPTAPAAPVVPACSSPPVSAPQQPPASSVPRDTTPVAPPAPAATPPASPGAPEEQHGQRDERLQGHIVTPAPTTERLQSIQRMVADQLGDKLPDFEADAAVRSRAGWRALSHLRTSGTSGRAGRAGSPAAVTSRSSRARSPGTAVADHIEPATAASASSA